MVHKNLKRLIESIAEESGGILTADEIYEHPALKRKDLIFLRMGQNINSASKFGLGSEWREETGKRYEGGVSVYFLKREGDKYIISFPDRMRASYGVGNDYFSNMFLNVLQRPICEEQIYVVRGNLVRIPDIEMEQSADIYPEYREFWTYDVGSDGEPLLESGSVSIVEQISLEKFLNNFYFSGGKSVKDLFVQEFKKEYNSLCDEIIDVLNKEVSGKEEIVKKIKDLKLYGFGGFCADAALQINNKVFSSKGEYVAAANKFWWEKENRIIGHVVVKYNNSYWDSEGETTLEKVESWGMLDEEDPEYSNHPDWTPEDAYEVELLELSEDEVMKYFDICRPQTLKEVITFLFENRQDTISDKEIENSIKRLPDELRKQFPAIDYVTRRGGELILPFELKKIWVKHPKILKDKDSFYFGLHLGNSFEEKIPSAEETKRVVEFIKEYIKNRGWHVFSWSITGRGETLQVEILPEKTEQLEDVPDVLYHLSDTANIPSIKRKGLKPRASFKQERSYSPRIYLFSDKELLEQQVEQNIKAHEEDGIWHPKLTKTLDMSIVTIDTKKLKKGTKFYRDPEFGGVAGAYYTFTDIPKESIIDIG